MGDDAGCYAPGKFFERKRTGDSGTTSEEREPKKRKILRGLCEQCKKIQKPGTITFKELAKADVVMLRAAKEGHLNCVKACLATGADVNQLVPVDKNNRGNLNGNYIEKKDRGLYKWKATALMKAAENGHHECLSLLVELGAVNVRDDNGVTALMKAADNGYTEIVDTLLRVGADVNIWNARGNTALMLAASKGSKTCLKKLIGAGADVNSQNCEGKTALMHAVNNMDSLRYLIEKGADVNSQNCDGKTVLMQALSCMDSLRYLVETGADLNSQDREGWTALMYAIDRARVRYMVRGDSVRCLTEAGADMNKQNNCGETALMLALKFGSNTFLNQLIEAGADVNIRYKDGNTILALASKFWRSVPVKSLIAAGANVNVVNFSRSTLLHHILKKTIRDSRPCSTAVQCIKSLLAAGAKVNTLDINYTKALTSYFQLRNETLLQTCLSTILDTSCPRVSPRSECNGACEAQVLTLFFAAGETVDDQPVKVSDYLDPPTDICLSHICREAIREHMMKVDPHENLFYRGQQLGLPTALQEYLLYNVTLKDDCEDDKLSSVSHDDMIIMKTDDDDDDQRSRYVIDDDDDDYR